MKRITIAIITLLTLPSCISMSLLAQRAENNVKRQQEAGKGGPVTEEEIRQDMRARMYKMSTETM